MEFGVPDAPKFIGITLAEIAQGLHVLAVFGELPAKSFQVGLTLQTQHIRGDQRAIAKHPQPLGRRVDIVGIAVFEIVGRDQFGNRDRAIHEQQKYARYNRQLVPPQLEPHHLPLRCEVKALLFRGQPLH